MNIFGRGKNTETTAIDDDLDVALDDDAGFDDTAVDENLSASRDTRGQRAGGNRKTILLLFVLLLAGGGFAGMMMMGGDNTPVAVAPPMAPATPIDATFQPAPFDGAGPEVTGLEPPLAPAPLDPVSFEPAQLDPALAGMPPMPVPAGDVPAGAVPVDAASADAVVTHVADPLAPPPPLDPALAGMPAGEPFVEGAVPVVAQGAAGLDPAAVDPSLAGVAPVNAVAVPFDPAGAVVDPLSPAHVVEGEQPPAVDTMVVAATPVDPAAPAAVVVPAQVPQPVSADTSVPAAPAAPAVTAAPVSAEAQAAEQALVDHAAMMDTEAALQTPTVGGYSPEDISRLWSALPVEDALVRPQPNKYLTVKKEKGADTLDSRLATARRALNEGRNPAALQFFNELRNDYPQDSRVLMGRAVTLQRLGQNADALQGYEDVLVNDPKHLDALTNMLGLLKKQNPQLAIEKLTDLRGLYPYNADITTQLSVVHAQAGNLNEALRFITLAEALKPDSAYVLYNKAVLYDRLGRTTEAADFYRQVLRRASDGTLDQTLPVESIRKRLSTIR